MIACEQLRHPGRVNLVVYIGFHTQGTPAASKGGENIKIKGVFHLFLPKRGNYISKQLPNPGTFKDIWLWWCS